MTLDASTLRKWKELSDALIDEATEGETKTSTYNLEAVANGVVVQSDAQFLLQMLTVQSEKIQELETEIDRLDDIILDIRSESELE